METPIKQQSEQDRRREVFEKISASPEWALVRQLAMDKMAELDSLRDGHVGGSPEMTAVEVRARQTACGILERFLGEIGLYKKVEPPIVKTKYRIMD